MLKVILNADDFGASIDTVAATIECFEAEALTSATIMPNMPSTEAAVRYAKGRDDCSFGAHLTFVSENPSTGERPVSNAGKLPSLVGPDGSFRNSHAVRLAALCGRLSIQEIVLEMDAQLARLRDMGLALSHVDSHGHLHKFPPFVEAMKQVLPRFGIQRVRSVQNLYLNRPWLSGTYWMGWWFDRKLRDLFAMPDLFFMPGSGSDGGAWSTDLLSHFEGSGLIEVGVHPGYQDYWRDAERTGVKQLAQLLDLNRVPKATWRAAEARRAF